MKVLLIHNSYRFRGGEDRHLEIQTDILRRRGHEVILYLRDSRELDSASWREKLSAAWETPYSRATYREIRKLAEVDSPDVAHVHNLLPLISPSAIRALADAGVPVVHTHHNYRLICPSGLLYTGGAICERCTGGSFRPAVYHRCVQNRVAPSLLYAATLGLHRVMRTYSEGVDLHLCPSQVLRQRIAAVLPAGSQVEVLPNFLPDHQAQPDPSPRPYVVFLGRISHEKGLHVLLEAMRVLPDVGVEVLGDGPLRPSLEESLDRTLRGRVRFRGVVADDSRFDILGGALALVVPSVCLENLPYSVLESLRAGVPVLASRLGGLVEVIREGENGLLFRPGDSGALVRAVKRLLLEPHLRPRLGRGARRSYLKRYSLEQGYERLMRHYRFLVGERSRVHATA